MGITDLLTTLKTIKIEKHISSYANKRVAIDMYVWIHKSFYCFARLKFTGSFEEDKAKIDQDQSYLYYIKSKLNMLIENSIIPIAIFDSERPKIKSETIGHKRNNTSANKIIKMDGNYKRYVNKLISTVVIDKTKIEAIIQLLSKMNIQFMFAPKEADSQLAYLSKQNLVDAVITEDSDQLVYVSLAF